MLNILWSCICFSGFPFYINIGAFPTIKAKGGSTYVTEFRVLEDKIF